MTWSQHCRTTREFLKRGLMVSSGYHIVTGIALLFWSAIGKPSVVSFVRFPFLFWLPLHSTIYSIYDSGVTCFSLYFSRRNSHSFFPRFLPPRRLSSSFRTPFPNSSLSRFQFHQYLDQLLFPFFKGSGRTGSHTSISCSCTSCLCSLVLP